MNIINVREALQEHPAGTFLDLANFNGTHLGACDIKGESPVWEMHPDTDELFFILDGEVQMTVLDQDAPRVLTAGAGTTFVVPKTIWHKPSALSGCTFIYYTPGQSLHSEAEDPRIPS